jgi:hypothetical protein
MGELTPGPTVRNHWKLRPMAGFLNNLLKKDNTFLPYNNFFNEWVLRS